MIPFEAVGAAITAKAPSPRELAAARLTEGVIPVHNDPTIVCCDLWPRGTLTQAKLDAYKRLIDTGDIKIRRVVHHKATGYTTVEYWSNLPHAWTLNKLRELAALLDQGTQTRMEV